VEDWAEIRRLYRAEGLAIKAIARKLGVSRNTVRAAIASATAPKYERKPAGSIVDVVEAKIREQLALDARMPATVIAERIGWTRGITVLKERVAELRPAYLPPDPASRTTYEAGDIAQCDLWFPPIQLPVGFGQTRRPAQLPVLTMVSGYSRWLSGQLIPTRAAPDLFAGWWQVIERLGAVPRTLVWDGEGAIGRWRHGKTELTGECQAFRGTLGAKVIVLKPREPEHKGVIERAHDYLERSSCPVAALAARPTSTPNCSSGWRSSTAAGAEYWAAHRPNASPPTGPRCCRCRRSHRRSGGGPALGSRAITTSASTPTTTRSTRPSSAAGSNWSSTCIGSGRSATAASSPITHGPGPGTRPSTSPTTWPPQSCCAVNASECSGQHRSRRSSSVAWPTTTPLSASTSMAGWPDGRPHWS
jgi:transposase